MNNFYPINSNPVFMGVFLTIRHSHRRKRLLLLFGSAIFCYRYWAVA